MDSANQVSQGERGSSRRNFLATTGIAVAGLSTAAIFGAAPAMAVDPPLKFDDIPFPKYLNLPGRTNVGYDVKVLNYALALEDLETDLYVQAVQRLTGGGINRLGTTITGLGLSSSEPDVSYLSEFTLIEAEHRDFIRGSLNELIDGIAIKPFKYDFGMETKSRQEVLDLVLDAEATGTVAYLGAIPHLGTKWFLTAAACIQGTEARHTATLKIVREQLYGAGGPGFVAPPASVNHGADIPMEPDEVLAKVSKYIVK